MSERLVYVEEARKNEIIASAVDRETPCVLTVPGSPGWQTFKSRFVAGESTIGRLLIAPSNTSGGADDDEQTASAVVPWDRAVVTGNRVGIAFRRGHKKCLFASIVLGRVQAGSEQTTECVELQWPDAVQEFQRRVYYRATPPGRKVHVRFWRGGVAGRAAADRDGGVLTGVIMDISAGGMRLLTPDVRESTFALDDPIGCSFTPRPRGETLVLDGVFRHFQTAGDGLGSVGIQFVGLEVSERGRETLAKLARIVTDYQRGHSRQQRSALSRSSVRH